MQYSHFARYLYAYFEHVKIAYNLSERNLFAKTLISSLTFGIH